MNLRKKYIASVVLLATSSIMASAATVPQKPNILLVVADDLGYSDLGSFGGEIKTPNLDSLAESGVRLTNFHTAPACSPTRAALITGVDPHIAGLGNMAELLAPNQKGEPGYEGHINSKVVTVAEILKDSGYRTYYTGKWHLGMSKDSNPQTRGFDNSFALLSGGASHFSDMKPAYAPTPEVKAPYTDDGVMIKKLPESFQYSSQYYSDKLISYLKEKQSSEQPFFAMLNFTAPHWPLQAPDAAIAKYKGVYDAGYDVLYKQRLASQKELGILPKGAEGAERPPKGTPWENLTSEQRKTESKAMEVYAAMVDEMDVYTGKVIEYLKDSGQYSNTLIVFISDNGPEGHDIDEVFSSELYPDIRHVIDSTNDFSYEQMGRLGSYTFLGPNWAWASSPAFRMHKGFPTEGGTRSVAIVKMPNVNGEGRIIDSYANVVDIAPTILEFANVSAPKGSYKGKKVEEISGQSFLPVLTGRTTGEDDRIAGGELFGKYFVRKGDWKLVLMPTPWGTGEEQLYDLSSDLAEKHDLSEKYPEVLAEMKIYWKEYVAKNNVILPDWVDGY
jgi:arylsulfatase